MKTLTLPLKKKWFDMIASGEKKEEYRNITQYWMRRLMFCYCRGFRPCKYESCSHPMPNLCSGVVKRFDAVTFTLGYPRADDTSRRMTFAVEDICFGEGKQEWGAEDGKMYFVIKLGRKL